MGEYYRIDLLFKCKFQKKSREANIAMLAWLDLQDVGVAHLLNRGTATNDCKGSGF